MPAILKRQDDQVARQARHEQTQLPFDMDYAQVAGLSSEVREKLIHHRPATVWPGGQNTGYDAGGCLLAVGPPQAGRHPQAGISGRQPRLAHAHRGAASAGARPQAC